MPLGIRIFLAYFLFVGLAGWFVLSTVMDEIRPGVRQSTEETLVDTANLTEPAEDLGYGHCGQIHMSRQMIGQDARDIVDEATAGNVGQRLDGDARFERSQQRLHINAGGGKQSFRERGSRREGRVG